MNPAHSHFMHPLSEIALLGLSVISVAASRLVLADATAPEAQFALQWFLLPMLGALCASVCAMLLNPAPEARKTVLARSIFGVVFGTAIPKVLSMVHPALKELALDPAITFLAGFVVCFLVYVIARPFVERLYARSGDIAGQLEARVEQKISQVTVTKSTTTLTPASAPAIAAAPVSPEVH